MPESIIRVPDSQHPIVVAPLFDHVVVVAGGKVIADTQRALALTEADLPPVLYIPRRDVDMTNLRRTSTSRYCPYKGEAAFFSIGVECSDDASEGAWTYGMPHWAVCEIEDHVAFDPDKVERIEMLAN